MLIYAMSDIHGFNDAFMAALKKVDLSGENQLILLGDYIDYGPESCEVLNTIRKLQNEYGKDKVIALLGNHEKDFLDWMEEYSDINRHIAGIEEYSCIEWLEKDRDADYETLKSFLSEENMKSFLASESVLSQDSRNIEAVKMLQENAGRTIQWLQGLDYYYETENQIFVHAGILEWAGENWEYITSKEYMTKSANISTGKFYKDVIAGHISTAQITGDSEFNGVFYDGKSHYYLDGTTYLSGKIPVLVYDTEEKKYFEL